MEVNPGEQQQEQLVYESERNRKSKRKVQIETVQPSFSTKHIIMVAVAIGAIFVSFIIYQITVRQQDLRQSIQIEAPNIGQKTISVSQGSSQDTAENLLNLNTTTNHQIAAQKDKKQIEAQKKYVFGSNPKKQQQFLIHPAKDVQKSSEDRQVLNEVSKQLLKLKNLKERREGSFRNEKSTPKATNKQQQQQYKEYLKQVTASPQNDYKNNINQQANQKEPLKEKQVQWRFPKQKEASSIKPSQQPKKHIQERMQKEEQPEIEQSIKRQQQRKIQQMKNKLQQEKREKPLRNKQRELKWKEQMAKKKAGQQQKKKQQIPSQLQRPQLAKNAFQIKRQQQEQKKKVAQLERQRQQMRKKQQYENKRSQQQENRRKLQQENRRRQQQQNRKRLQQEDRKRRQQLMKRQKMMLQQRRKQQEQRKRTQQQHNKKRLEQQQRKRQQAQIQKLKEIEQERAKRQQLKKLESQKQKKDKDPQSAQPQQTLQEFIQKKKQQIQKMKAEQQRKKMEQQKNKDLLAGKKLVGLSKPQQALKQLSITEKQPPAAKEQQNKKPYDKLQQGQQLQSKQNSQLPKEKGNMVQLNPKKSETQQKTKQEVNLQSQQIKKLQQQQLRKQNEMIAALRQMQVKRQKRQPQIQKLLKEFDQYNEQNDKKIPKMSTITPSTENRFPIDMVELYGIHDFIIPKLVWTYVDFIERQSLFIRRCIENQRHFARLSLFQLLIVNATNFKAYIPQQTVHQIEETLNKLQQRMRKQPQSNLKDHFETIRRRSIMFHILNERGGIFVQANVLFTENFNWLRDINKNRYVNTGSINARAQYVGFSDIDHGTPYEKHNKIGAVYEPEKYMIEFPSFEPYFLAAVAKGEFLTRVLEEYGGLLHEPNSLQEKMQKHDVKMGAIFGKDLYYEVFYISQHIALRKKQGEINSSGNSKGNKFAIDYYGFFTINQRYFPKKIQFTFENNLKQKIYRNLAKYTLEQLQQTVGPLSYIVCMPFEDHMNYMLEDIKRRNLAEEIHPQSFLSKFVVRNMSQPFIQRQLEVNKVDAKGKIWDRLPKVIWIFWDTGFNNSGINYKLCIDNIRRNAHLSQFQVRQLNNSNIQHYLGNDINGRITKYFQNTKIKTFPQTKSDFVRLAIIAKHGGIYMDASYFAVENLDWIINIAKYPSKYIFNRYGELPSVLMLFHPHFGQPFQWKFDREANTKNMWLSAYQNNLLIAEPNQEIFKDWFEQFGNFITRPYQQSQKLMAQYNIIGDRWTYRDNTYLVAMDAIKVAIGKKQKQIRQLMKNKDYKGPKSAAEYYRIWSMSGYRGQQKFRAHTNFDNTYTSKPFNSDNVLLWRYSQQYVTGIIGKVNHFVKLYGKNIQYLNEVLERSYDSNFKSQIHPQSFFMNYLYNTSIHKITRKNGKLQLEYLKK